MASGPDRDRQRWPGTPVHLKVWRIDVGRVKLYLLDSNIAQNADPAHRDITGQLYAGDQHKRIRQEIALGIGGLRALEVLGLQPTVYHMNEGHSAFLALERIRVLMARRAVELRGSAGGHARQQRLHHAHLGARGYRSVRTRPDVRVLPGLLPGDRDSLRGPAGAGPAQSRTIRRSRFRWPSRRSRPRPTATRSAGCIASVSQQMWQDLWPKLPVWEVPITSITNGVHLPTWINGDLAGSVRPVPAAGLARGTRRAGDLGAGCRDSRRGAVGGAPPPQTAPDRLRAGAGRGQRGGAQGLLRRRSGASRRCSIRRR